MAVPGPMDGRHDGILGALGSVTGS